MQTQIEFSNVHENSIRTYREKVLPEIRGRKLEFYSAIKALGGEADLFEIAQYLNRPLHTISGRSSELKRMEMIEDTGRVKEHNGNNFTILKIT